jgi:hypothetical protein
MNPVGYHLTNILVHAMNVALLYVVSLRLLRATTWGDGARHASAATAALFFGLHPLRTESVAWITERRDVLSMAFFLVAILLYLRAQDAGASRRRLMVFSLATFALGLASKSMIMTLPVVLVILDVYPLRRIRFDASSWPQTRAALLEKVPFAVLGLIGAGLGYYGQQSNQFFTSLERYPWAARVAIVGYAYWFYLWKTVLPVSLGPLYQLPASVSVLNIQFAAAWLLTGLITAVAVLLRRRYPIVLAVWAYYAVTLLPVSGIAHAGYQVASDRYCYLPSVGFAVLVGVVLGALLSLRSEVRPAFVRLGCGGIAALVLGLGALSWQQAQIWRDTETLWSYAVDVDPTCSVCHTNLGVWLGNQGNLAAGIRDLEIALALRPDLTSVHTPLAVLYLNANHLPEAVDHLEKRLAQKPNDVESLVVLGLVRIRQGRAEEARAPLARALSLNSADVGARLNYAAALGEVGLREEAIAEHRRAIAADDRSAPAHYAYGWTLAKFGDREGAREQLAELGRLDPKLAAKLALYLAHGS